MMVDWLLKVRPHVAAAERAERAPSPKPSHADRESARAQQRARAPSMRRDRVVEGAERVALFARVQERRRVVVVASSEVRVDDAPRILVARDVSVATPHADRDEDGAGVATKRR